MLARQNEGFKQFCIIDEVSDVEIDINIIDLVVKNLDF
jgi:hypothetical protein